MQRAFMRACARVRIRTHFYMLGISAVGEMGVGCAPRQILCFTKTRLLHTLKRLNFTALACSFRNFNGVNYLAGRVRVCERACMPFYEMKVCTMHNGAHFAIYIKRRLMDQQPCMHPRGDSLRYCIANSTPRALMILRFSKIFNFLASSAEAHLRTH